MKRVMLIFGTRPEAIKMAPLVTELRSRKNFEVIVCVTGQHREMLQQVLDVFGLVPDVNLDIMSKEQTLYDITTKILNGVRDVLREHKPDVVLVHGDTTTTFASALACYYEQIDVGHVEAGLRTFDIYSPFPEEFNRQAVSLIARYNFAPTIQSQNNLLACGVKKESIYVTGNTVIDALKTTVIEEFEDDNIRWSVDSELILLTAHRRENLGEPMRHIFNAIKRICTINPRVKVIYPIHLNPQIRDLANEIFMDLDQVRIIEPLSVTKFHNYINSAKIILTDSGGIQEEAPSLGKPVLVLREVTERPEGVLAGTLKIVGTNEELIVQETLKLLSDANYYNSMAKSANPYGDGLASKRIADVLMGTADENI